MYDLIYLPRLIRELPVRSDEATLQLSEPLHTLSQLFDDCCHQQILRAHRERCRQRRRRSAMRSPYEPHDKLREEYEQRLSRGRPRS
jgi:hypothetical protein